MLKLLKQKAKYLEISGLVTNSALTAVENKMSDVSNLVTQKNQKYQILNLNILDILLQLITMNLLKILLVIA